jgi:transcriptional regulator with XRE-family HTH domain
MTRGLRLYKSYSFREKDPCIDVLRTLVRDSGKTYAGVEDASGVTAQTLRNWFHGTTRRPQFATVAAVARALDKTIRFGGTEVKPKKSNGK